MRIKDVVRVWVSVSAIAAMGAPALGQQPSVVEDTLVLTLSQARSTALESSPWLAARSWRPEAVRGDLTTASLFPFNPELSFESRSPSEGLSNRFEVELGMQFEIARQGGLRRRAGEEALASANGEFRDDVRKLLGEVENAFLRLWAAERRATVAAEVRLVGTQLRDAVRTQLEEGVASRLEANLVAVDAATATARSLEAEADRLAASFDLGRTLGLPSRTVIRAGTVLGTTLAPPEGDVEALVAEALSTRPDLQALDHDVQRAVQEERLFRRSAFPDLRVAALAMRESPFQDPVLGLGVGIEVPLFNRNQGRTQRGRAEVSEAQGMRRAKALEIRSEVERAVRVYALAQRELAAFESDVLKPIRETRGMLETAYQEGKMDLGNLLLIRDRLLESELTYWDAWERRARAGTALRTATGRILAGVSTMEGPVS